MEPNNGDIYLRDDDQIIIFFDEDKCHDTSLANSCITAIFSASGKWGMSTKNYHKRYIQEINGDPYRGTCSMKFVGNLTDIFRGILNDCSKAR